VQSSFHFGFLIRQGGYRLPSKLYRCLILSISVLASQCVTVPPACAADKISVDTLQAAVHSLGFLETLPKDGTINAGVIYAADMPSTETSAEEAARVLNSTPGPNSSRLRAIVLSTDGLSQFRGRLDVIFLMPGSSGHADQILNVMHAHQLVSISDDPACLDRNCCVLMVHSGQRMEIVLNTALANSVGARFSLVFTMVVKRK